MFHDIQDKFFYEWIAPATMEIFRGQSVLECGCGSGRDTTLMASVAKSVTAVDLNTPDIAKKRNSHLSNIEFLQADIASMRLGRQYDVVLCVGVIHHTDNPDETFKTIYEHCRSGGKIIIWAYAAEGNGLVRWVVEPIRKIFLRWLPRKVVRVISTVIAAVLTPIVYTLYSFSAARFLPYYEYFQAFKKNDFQRNMINIFDKLNAPLTHFIPREKCNAWFNSERFEPESIVIRHHLGVSYTMIGQKR